MRNFDSQSKVMQSNGLLSVYFPPTKTIQPPRLLPYCRTEIKLILRKFSVPIFCPVFYCDLDAIKDDI